MATAHIQWHQMCLSNEKSTLAVMERDMEKLAGAIKQLRDDITVYELQIQRAHEENRTRFDRERYGVKKERRRG